MPKPQRRACQATRDPLPSWVPRHGTQRPELVIWGAHGGAGTSTLAAWLQPAWDMGAMRAEPDPPYPAEVASGRALVVACRDTAWASRQATKAVSAVIAQGGQVAALAVVSDGWPEPAIAASRFRLLEARAGSVIRVPFVPALRATDDPSAVTLPRRARSALVQIHVAAGQSLSLPPLPPET